MSSTVKLVVGEEEICFEVNPTVLAANSDVFKAMFFGPLADTRDLIPLPEDHPKALSILINYCCTSELEVRSIKEALAAYHLFDKYLIIAGKEECIQYLVKRINVFTVETILEAAEELQVDSLAFSCWSYIQRNIKEVLNKGMMNMSEDMVEKIIRQDFLGYPGQCTEIDIYEAVVRYGKRKLRHRKSAGNLRDVLRRFLCHIRFQTISYEEFALRVCGSGVFTDLEEVKILKAFRESILYPCTEPIVIPDFNTSKEDRSAWDNPYFQNCTQRANDTALVVSERLRAVSCDIYIYGVVLHDKLRSDTPPLLSIWNITRKKGKTLEAFKATDSWDWEMQFNSAVFVATGDIFQIKLETGTNEPIPCCTRKCRCRGPLMERVSNTRDGNDDGCHFQRITAFPLKA